MRTATRSPLRYFLPLLALAPLLLLAACSGDDDDEPAQYAEPRPYAGLLVGSGVFEPWGELLLVRILDDLGPAASVGVAQGDIIRAVDGETVDSPVDFYAFLEEKRPGDVVEIVLDRPVEAIPDPSRLPPGVRPGEIYLEPHTVSVHLVEEPVPSDRLRTPYSSLDEQDELRLGFYLGEITRPVADYYGIQGPEGVYIASPLAQLLRGNEDFEEGDVIIELAGSKVNTLANVQSVIDDLDKDEPIEVVIRRDGQNETYTLGPLGPNVYGANQFPPEARERLQAAIDRGDLHPDRVWLHIRPHFWRTDPRPGEATLRIGAITAISDDSITIEVYSTGREWTLDLLAPEPDLHVGEFVQIHSQDGTRATQIFSLAGPLPRTP